MNSSLSYSIIILFIISITINNSSNMIAKISDLSINRILFNETNMTMNNKTENSKNSNTSETCVMPECPSGNVCVQVCPESVPAV